MTPKIKNVLLFAIGAIIGFIVVNNLNSSEIEELETKSQEFQRRQDQRDLEVDSLNLVLDSLPKERIRLMNITDSLYKELDSAYIRVEKLSKPEVTQETINETKRWIEVYNSSLQ